MAWLWVTWLHRPTGSRWPAGHGTPRVHPHGHSRLLRVSSYKLLTSGSLCRGIHASGSRDSIWTGGPSRIAHGRHGLLLRRLRMVHLVRLLHLTHRRAVLRARRLRGVMLTLNSVAHGRGRLLWSMHLGRILWHPNPLRATGGGHGGLLRRRRWLTPHLLLLRRVPIRSGRLRRAPRHRRV